MMIRSMADQVMETIKKHNMIRQGDLVLVALSGGPDSLALLHLLKGLQDKLGITLQAAHLDHGLRGDASAAEAQWVADVCRHWGIPCAMGYWEAHDHPRQGLSPEEAARRARLDFLQKVQKETGAAVIAQGHHGDDQAETLIIRLLNGAGAGGLGGIKPVRGPFIRPLLEVTRQEILDYCRDHGLEPRQDESNLTDDYLRNRIRHHVMPLLQQINPSLTQTLCRTAAVLQAEDAYLDRLAAQKLKEIEASGAKAGSKTGAKELLVSGLNGLDPVLARRIIRLWAGIPLDFAGVQRVLELAASGRTGSQADLTGHFYVRKTYTTLQLRKGPASVCSHEEQVIGRGAGAQRIRITEPLRIQNTQIVLQAQWLPFPEEGAAFLACPGIGACLVRKGLKDGTGVDPACGLDQGTVVRESLCLPWDPAAGLPVVRGREPGDWVQFPYGRKKLKAWFIDQKIPSEQREQAIIIALGQQVLWIPGLLKSQGPFSPQRCSGCLWLEVTRAEERN